MKCIINQGLATRGLCQSSCELLAVLRVVSILGGFVSSTMKVLDTAMKDCVYKVRDIMFLKHASYAVRPRSTSMAAAPPAHL